MPFCCDGKSFLLSGIKYFHGQRFTGLFSQVQLEPMMEALLMLSSFSINPRLGQVLDISSSAT